MWVPGPWAATGCAGDFPCHSSHARRPIPWRGGRNSFRPSSNETYRTIPAAALRRFWNMVAHYHGQIWNAAELARALAINEITVRRYLDLMSAVV